MMTREEKYKAMEKHIDEDYTKSLRDVLLECEAKMKRLHDIRHDRRLRNKLQLIIDQAVNG